MKFILFIFFLYLVFSYNKILLVEKCQVIEYFKEFCFLKSQNKYNKNLSYEKYEKLLKSWYKKKTNLKLDINNPKTLNEKIQWLKLYDSTPIKTLLADKYLVKNYIKNKIGEKYVIPLLKVWDSYKNINFDSLPNKFVLKANHGSGMNIIIYNKKKTNIKKIKKIAKKWMKKNYAFENGYEFHYMNIKPKIIAEKYFDNIKGDLYDYKVYCFDGRVESIAFLSGKKKFRRIAFFDSQWNRLNYTDTYPPFKKKIPKPNKLNEMIKISQILSKGFAFVRIDFYILNNGEIKFGEMTFTPFSGLINFNPKEQDRIFGEMIKLPNKSLIPKKII